MAACFGLVLADRMGFLPGLAPFSLALYEWAIILGGVALLLGVLNVLLVHLRRIQHGDAEWWMSLVLIITLLAVLLAGVVNPEADRSPLLEWTFDSILAPGYGTLFALVIFFLGAALFHRLRVGRPGGGWVLAGLLLMLMAQTPAAQTLLAPAWFATIESILRGPVTATMRGALLGVGLALVVVAFHTLLGRRDA
jgi:hypothetical protein